MHVTEIGAVSRHRAPHPDGPTAQPMTPADAGGKVAVLHVELPAGCGMPEHDHGDSEIVLIPLAGSIELRHGDEQYTLSPGSTAQIATGERVSLANPGTESASLMVVASPPEFVQRVATWPVV